MALLGSRIACGFVSRMRAEHSDSYFSSEEFRAVMARLAEALKVLAMKQMRSFDADLSPPRLRSDEISL